MQDDVLLGNLTVRETLLYCAKLRLPSSISDTEKEKTVARIIKQLGLTRCAANRVGDQMTRGISGGERKRASIGIELVTDPGILFLDEPTSGLDAANALSVVKHLINLTHQGKTVICTIHQPRSNLFKLFDLLLLMREGKCVYFGPASESTNYFSSLGFDCPNLTNPADHFLDVLQPSEADPSDRTETGESVVSCDFAEAFQQSSLHSQLISDISDELQRIQTARNSTKEGKKKHHHMSEYATSFIYQTWILLCRSNKALYRSPLATYIQFSQQIFLAVLLGALYLRLSDDAYQSKAGALYVMLVNSAFSSLAAINVFLLERALFNRENAAGFYRTSAYFIAKSLAEFPLLVVYPIIFGSIVYWMVGFKAHIENFLYFLLILIMNSCIANSYCLWIGSLAPTPQLANVLAPVLLVIFMLFGGFFAPLQHVQVWLSWLQWISFFKYEFEILMVNEFDGQEEVLSGFNLSKSNLLRNLLILLALFFFFRLTAYLFLRFLNKEKR
eukprot:TRINITY_DN535_c0_g2_i1.p1 TRINITY_DN535_c0_g2~~TRINITY_DN535_c0_g2_i1.p1  ORF type:complete len:502 (-),score=110.74 TRINITY_DN535_c0_g2_i1:891-2396(-)